MRSRCNATVWMRDTHRRSGRSPSRMRLHRSKKQCSRLALLGSDYCRQHRDGNYQAIPWRDKESPTLVTLPDKT